MLRTMCRYSDNHAFKLHAGASDLKESYLERVASKLPVREVHSYEVTYLPAEAEDNLPFAEATCVSAILSIPHDSFAISDCSPLHTWCDRQLNTGLLMYYVL
jgi:hypothetical protein